MRDLKEIRKDIDKIDNQLIELFKQRMDCARDVGIYKQANNIPVLNEGRENEILDAVEEKGGEYGASARLLYSNIMELSRALQHNIVGSGKELKSVINNASTDIPSSGIKVAYQGIKGANGHEATLRLFPNGEAVNYKSFADVFSAVDNGEVAFGVLPVENSSAGSVSAVYDLILKHRFYIVRHSICRLTTALQVLNNLLLRTLKSCGRIRSHFHNVRSILPTTALILFRSPTRQLPPVMLQRKSVSMLRQSVHTKRVRNTA